MTGYLLMSGKPLLLGPDIFDQFCRENDIHPLGTKAYSLIGAPFYLDHLAGAVVVQSYSEVVYTEKDKDLLEYVARHIGDALARKVTADDRAVVHSGAPLEVEDHLNGRIYATIKFPNVIATLEDIPELKKHEKEQHKLEKLESLGGLAGGIAHDFNNVLTGIMANISFAQLLIDPGHRSFKPLAEAEKASRRAAELAEQLLTFARGG